MFWMGQDLMEKMDEYHSLARSWETLMTWCGPKSISDKCLCLKGLHNHFSYFKVFIYILSLYVFKILTRPLIITMETLNFDLCRTFLINKYYCLTKDASDENGFKIPTQMVLELRRFSLGPVQIALQNSVATCRSLSRLSLILVYSTYILCTCSNMCTALVLLAASGTSDTL